MSSKPKNDSYEMAFKTFSTARATFVAGQILLLLIFIVSLAGTVITFFSSLSAEKPEGLMLLCLGCILATCISLVFVDTREESFSSWASDAPPTRFLLAFFNPEEIKRCRLVKFSKNLAIVEYDGQYMLKIDRKSRQYLYGHNDARKLSFDSMLRPQELIYVVNNPLYWLDDPA